MRPAPIVLLLVLSVLASTGAPLAQTGWNLRSAPLLYDETDDGTLVQETSAPIGFALCVLQPSSEPPGLRRVFRCFTAHSLALPAGASVDPTIAAADLEVAFAGWVRSARGGRFRLGVEVVGGTGRLCLGGGGPTIATEPRDGRSIAWTDWIDAPAGLDEHVTVWGRRDGAGEFAVRPLWERENRDDRGFRPEPIPERAVEFSLPCSFHADDRMAPVGAHSGPADYEKHPRITVEFERVLVGEFGCLNCHATGRPTTVPPPTRKGPDLAGIGERVHADWLADWIADPQAKKPGIGMPDVFRDTPADEADVDALVAYLLDGAESPDPSPAASDEPLATEPATLARGRELYHTLGCIACHGALASPAEVFDEPLLDDAVPDVRVAAPFVALHEKWRPRALAAFLKDPRASWPDSPMPSMNLTDEEADLIATYLLSRVPRPERASDTSAEPPASQVERGRVVFGERGCAHCHVAPDAPRAAASAERTYAEPSEVPLTAWRPNEGCLGESKTAPRYEFGWQVPDGAAAVLSRAEIADAPLDRAHDVYTTLNCQACHARDGRGGLPDELRPYFVGLEESAELGDEARIPPELTGVGRKLQTPWLEEVLVGGGRARPYMAARMPQFAPDEVGFLAHGLAYADGVRPHTDRDEPAVTDELVLAGKRLMGIRGLACISCHVVGDLPPAGTPGPDMTQFAARLRYDWFRDYMHDPARFKPGTRMPQFTTKGQSAITDLFGGDAERQIDAMWAYFTLGEFLPVPEGVPKPGELALVPDEHSIVFRTFLESVGSRAICVGTPSGLHYAFDAEDVRLAEVWKGDFVDASANWTARGGGQASGRGAVVWTAPEGAAVRLGRNVGSADEPAFESFDARVAFEGYRLDEHGVPTFRYAVSCDELELACRIDETVVTYPRPGAAFARLVAVRGLAPRDTLLVPVHANVRPFAGPAGSLAELPPNGRFVGALANVHTTSLPSSAWSDGAGTTRPEGSGEPVATQWVTIEHAGPGDPLYTGDDEPMLFSIEVAE